MTLGEAVVVFHSLRPGDPPWFALETSIAKLYEQIVFREPYRSSKVVDVLGADGRWYRMSGVFRRGLGWRDSNGIAVACMNDLSGMEVPDDPR